MKRILPPDPEDRNDDRAAWANDAILAFVAATRTDKEDAAADLIADLGHWCDRNGLNFLTQVRRGLRHYAEETESTLIEVGDDQEENNQ